jgi:predicted nucleic-acid-binding Zn-ribbon protein
MPDQPDKPIPPFPPKRLNQDLAEKKFDEFWEGPVKCPVCNTYAWHFGEDLVHLFHFNVFGEQEASGYPSVVVICNKCGYTMLFNARKLGLDNG